MQKNRLNEDHFTRIRKFRQLYPQCFLKRRDVLCSLAEALKQTPHLSSFAELSLAPAFQHRWPSVYDIDKAEIATDKLNLLCLQQVPVRAMSFYALDVMNLRRAASETLKDRMVCHGAKREAFGNGIVLGLPYSLLCLTENAGSSWAPSVNCQRIRPEQKAVEVAVGQLQWLAANTEPDCTSVALDGGYGNLGFFLGLQGTEVFAAARMRNDRMLYRRPAERGGGRGRPAKYGKPFKFSEAETWGAAEETQEFEDGRYGRVRLEKWSRLRLRAAEEVVEIEVVRVQIHLEREKPKRARWYGIHNGTGKPTGLGRCLETIKHRWTIEPGNRFRKDRLHAEVPRFREAESSDRWMQLGQVVEWETYLFRESADDQRMPWQKPLSVEQLTPGRVLKSLAANLGEVGEFSPEVRPRGKSKGWEKGRVRRRPERHQIKLKGKKKPRVVEKVE